MYDINTCSKSKNLWVLVAVIFLLFTTNLGLQNFAGHSPALNLSTDISHNQKSHSSYLLLVFVSFLPFDYLADSVPNPYTSHDFSNNRSTHTRECGFTVVLYIDERFCQSLQAHDLSKIVCFDHNPVKNRFKIKGLHITTPSFAIVSTHIFHLQKSNSLFILCKMSLMSQMLVILSSSGDIHPNPGPKCKWPCGICGKAVRWNQEGIQCDHCEQWLHRDCIPMSPGMYQILSEHSQLSWCCCTCGMPSFSSSLFWTSGTNSFIHDNSFAILSSPELSNNNSDSDYSHLSDSPSSGKNSSVGEPVSSSTPSKPSKKQKRSFSGPSHHSKQTADQNKLRLLILNCQSIFGKRAAFAELVHSSDPHIIVGTESWLNPSIKNSECFPENYTVYRKDRERGKAGGVFIAVRNDLISTHLISLDVDCELIWISLQMVNSKQIHIGCFYRPPSKGSDPIKKLRESLSRIDFSKNPIVWVGGDFNVPDIDWSNLCRKPEHHCVYPQELTTELLDLIHDFSLTQLAYEPNHNQKTRSGNVRNILDLLLVTNPGCFAPIVTKAGISDHFNMIAEVSLRPVLHKAKRRKIYLWDKADTFNLRKDMEHFFQVFQANYAHKTVEENWNAFKEAIYSSVDSNVPSRYKSTRFNLPWINGTLKRLIRKKNRAFYSAKTDGSHRNWCRYRQLRKQVQKELRKAEQHFLGTTVFDSLTSNPKKFWSFIKQKRRDTNGISALYSKGKLADTAREKAEVLSDQYQSVFTKEDLINIPHMGQRQIPTISDLIISTEGIMKLLKNLDVNKASGPDGISPKFLKLCAAQVAPILQVIFTQSLRTGTLPRDWRQANINALYKNGSRSDPANYRPVSLTSTCCKVLEHIIYRHIMSHLEENNILSNTQHGFRSRRSCESQLITTIHHIFSSVETIKQVDAVVLDFAKAFDTVPHQRLLHRLKYLGIQGSLLSWISQFLTEREQTVVVQGSSSRPVHVSSGVPQGTVLGPLLFLSYINNLPDQVSSNVCLFADDCVVYRPIKTHKDCVILQQDLRTLEAWGKKWQMKYKLDKCNVMRFTRKSRPIHHTYTLAGHQIETVSSHKYLGVVLSDNLKWNRHIDITTARASSMIGFLRRNLHNAPRNVKLQAYKSLVRPHLEYCCTVWDPFTQRNISKIQAVQNRAARFICNDYKWQSSVSGMIKDLKLHPLPERRKLLRLSTFHKIKHGNIDLNLEDYISPAQAPRGMTTRSYHPDNYSTLHGSSTALANSFFHRTTKDWNNLPSNIKQIHKFDTFKEALQRHLRCD